MSEERLKWKKKASQKHRIDHGHVVGADQNWAIRISLQNPVQLSPDGFSIPTTIASQPAQKEDKKWAEPEKVNKPPESLHAKGNAISNSEFHSRSIQKKAAGAAGDCENPAHA